MDQNQNEVSKYELALSLYNTDLDDNRMKQTVAEIIAEKVDNNNTESVKKLLFSCLDLTSLNTTDTEESILKLTDKVNQLDDVYPGVPLVSALCVYPSLVGVVNENVEVDIDIACVTGGFPHGQTFIEVKIAETALAARNGADEFDLIIPVGAFLSGDYESMCETIQEIKDNCREKPLKVILETGALGSASNIKKAAILAMYSGADFIKTSTGKLQPAATPEAAYVMCQTIKEYYDKTGNKIGFKAAGGINTVRDALVYYTIVKEVLGEEWLRKDLFRIGASKLANLLLSDILKEEIRYF